MKISRAAAVVTISEFNRRFLTATVGDDESPVLVVRCGVDLQVSTAHIRREDSSPPGVSQIVAVGALEPKKGHSYLIDAVSTLRTSGLDVRLTIVGDGNERGRLENAIAARGLSDVVRLAGWLPKPRVLDALTAADVFVMPSVRLANGMMEGIPVALMEAMACGLPVVASDISGISELVVDGVTGVLVPERDHRALASAIMRLSQEPVLAAELAEAGRAKVAEMYDLGSNVAKLRELFASFNQSSVGVAK
jgi:glycosyltransferase involved in cell wall biosynthesis